MLMTDEFQTASWVPLIRLAGRLATFGLWISERCLEIAMVAAGVVQYSIVDVPRGLWSCLALSVTALPAFWSLSA